MPVALEKLSDEELQLERERLLQENERLKVDPDDLTKLSPAGLEARRQQLIKERGELTLDPPPGVTDTLTDEELEKAIQLLNKRELAGMRADEIIDPKVARPMLRGDKIDTDGGPITFLEALGNTRVLEKLPFVGSMYTAGRIARLFGAAQRLSLPDDAMVIDLDVPYQVHPLLVDPVIRSLVLANPNMVRIGDHRKEYMKIVEDWTTEIEERQRRGITVGGRIAEGVTELPSFMVEFLLTGPLFRTGSAAAKKATTKLLGRFAEKGVGKLAVRVAGAGFGTVVRTAVNVPRVMAGAAQKMTEGIQVTDDGAIVFTEAAKSPFTAIARSFGELYIENLTEIAGPSIKKGAITIGKGIGKRFPVLNKITQAIADKWMANKAGRTLSAFMKASATKVGYDGILEEMGEEQLGRILRVATGLDDFDQILPSMEELLVEAGIFAIPGGISLATTTLLRKPDESISIDRTVGLLHAVEQAKERRQSAQTKMEVVKSNLSLIGLEIAGTFDMLRRNTLRAEDAVSFWGKAGKKVQRDFQEISARSAANSAKTSQAIGRLIDKLSAEDKVIVAQLADGAIKEKGQPRRLVIRARLMRRVLDMMQKEAIAVGLRKGKLTGRAFPQVPNAAGKAFLEEAFKKGKNSHRVFAWAQSQVSDGRFKTIDSAIVALQAYRARSLRGTQPYLEGERTIELPPELRELNPSKVLPGVIESSWQAIEAARQWGVTTGGNFTGIAVSIERIRDEIGPDQATILENYVKAQFGHPLSSEVARKWSSRARAVQFVGKLAFSPLTITRNIMDRYAKGLAYGTFFTNLKASAAYPPFLNQWLKSSRDIEKAMGLEGAVLAHGHLSEVASESGRVVSLFGKAFITSERGNQTYIALVKKMQLETDLRRLNEMGGESGTVGKMHNRLLYIVGRSQAQTRSRVLTDLTNEQLADALVSGKLSDDVMSEVLHRATTDAAFPLTLASKRMWWGNRPWVQAMSQFKIWSADQLRFISKDVIKYTITTKDPSRLVRFIIGTWLAGEMYNISRDFMLDRDESLLSTLTDPDGRNFKEVSRSLANALVDGGIVGLIWDLTYGATNWAIGPTGGSIKNVVRGGIEAMVDPATLADATKQFILADIPAARQAQSLLNKINRTFYDEDENLTEHYAKWRERSFQFNREQRRKQVGVVKEVIARTALGFQKGIPGPRTLSLELISRQVLVGDFEDAADFMVGIVKDTPIEELKNLRASFMQSMRNHSPLGNMSREDAPRFLAKFSKEGQAEIEALQLRWILNYHKALNVASKQLDKEGFFKDLMEQTKELTIE